MKNSGKKGFLIGFIVLLFSTFAVTVSAGFVLFVTLRASLTQIENITRTRGRELGITLAAFAGENMTDKGLVRVSAAMNRVVKASRGRADYFEVREIALLDRKGRVRAHSDVTKAASDARSIYKNEKYGSVLNLPFQEPVLFEIVESLKVDFPFAEYLEEYTVYIKKIWPDFSVSGEKYHMGFAVYTPDEKIAVARMHMMVDIKSPIMLLKSVKTIIIEIALFTLLFVPILTVILTAIFLLSGSRQSTREKPEVFTVKAAALAVEKPGDGKSGVEPSRILDAIPLD